MFSWAESSVTYAKTNKKDINLCIILKALFQMLFIFQVQNQAN